MTNKQIKLIVCCLVGLGSIPTGEGGGLKEKDGSLTSSSQDQYGDSTMVGENEGGAEGL